MVFDEVAVMSIYRRLKLLRWGMLLLNLVTVLTWSGLQVVAVQYSIDWSLSMELLQLLEKVPGSPWTVFWKVIVVYLILSAILLKGKNPKYPWIFYTLPVILTIVLILLLKGAYNGIVLMVCCFYLPGEKSVKTPWRMVAFSIILFILTQTDLVSLIIGPGNPDAYICIFDKQVQTMLNILFSILSTVNLAGYIFYVSCFLLDQYQRAENMEKELEMVSAVNTELQNYAAITEKIGEDKERKRLAREIHDTLGHALTGISAGIDACQVLIDIDPEATKQQLAVVSKVVRQGIVDVRNSLNKLRPGALESSSFKTALEKMICEFMEVSSLQIHFDYRLEDYDFDVVKEDMLFRIIQESITNALRHGHASEIWISMYGDEGRLIVSIRDNGIGCSKIVPGYGIRQMEERAAMMGGFIIQDGSQGFMTIINLPVEKGENKETKLL